MSTTIMPPGTAASTSRTLPPLNRDQTAALAAIINVVSGEPYGDFLLEGRAGSGKTRLLVEVVRRYRGRVAVCAPTHKAASVLFAMLRAEPSIDVSLGFTRKAASDDHSEDDALPRVEIGTVHSLMGLQPSEDDQGVERLVPVALSAVDMFSLIVIDEASMLGTALQSQIDTFCRGVSVLYCGDSGQLPPVGELSAPCFTTIRDRFTLARIVRQQRGNPIPAVASALRDQQAGAAASMGIDTAWARGLPPWRPGEAGVFSATEDDINAAFRNDPENCRMLAYTNNATIMHNHRIRAALRGETGAPFDVGERCLVRSPVIALSSQGEREIILPVNSEPIVRDIHATQVTLKLGGPPWRGRGRWFDRKDLAAPVWRLCLQHDGQEIICDIERKPGMRENWLGTATRSGRWDDRWRIRAALNDIRHVHAITVHTSQGSTYRTVFVDMTDMLLSGMATRMERLKLIYTACTRPGMALGVYWEAPIF